MRRVVIALCVAGGLAGCAPVSKQEKMELAQPVQCSTAEGDIRMLTAEKTHAMRRIAAGAISIVPVGFIYGVATQSEGDRLDLAVGHYNQLIDEKIAKIKATCGLD